MSLKVKALIEFVKPLAAIKSCAFFSIVSSQNQSKGDSQFQNQRDVSLPTGGKSTAKRQRRLTHAYN